MAGANRSRLWTVDHNTSLLFSAPSSMGKAKIIKKKNSSPKPVFKERRAATGEKDHANESDLDWWILPTKVIWMLPHEPRCHLVYPHCGLEIKKIVCVTTLN